MIRGAFQNNEKELLRLLDFRLFTLSMAKNISICSTFVFAALLVLFLGGGWLSIVVFSGAFLYLPLRRLAVHAKAKKNLQKNPEYLELYSAYTFDPENETSFAAELCRVQEKVNSKGETKRVEKGKKAAEVEYASVLRACRHKGVFYLFLPVSVLILPETSLTEGSAEELESLLRERVGRRYTKKAIRLPKEFNSKDKKRK